MAYLLILYIFLPSLIINLGAVELFSLLEIPEKIKLKQEKLEHQLIKIDALQTFDLKYVENRLVLFINAAVARRIALCLGPEQLPPRISPRDNSSRPRL